MDEAPKNLSLEQRLAAKLRENLKRRKEQALAQRELGPQAGSKLPSARRHEVPDRVRDDALPKAPPKS
jgi:FKBP-type peptidyl-prolyl cis-trans isomerase (trigger factor)